MQFASHLHRLSLLAENLGGRGHWMLPKKGICRLEWAKAWRLKQHKFEQGRSNTIIGIPFEAFCPPKRPGPPAINLTRKEPRNEGSIGGSRFEKPWKPFRTPKTFYRTFRVISHFAKGGFGERRKNPLSN